MKLVTFSRNNMDLRIGAIVGETIVDLAELANRNGEYLPSTMLEFIEESPMSLELANKLVAKGAFGSGVAFFKENVKIHAPIPKPKKNIFGIGLNYHKHIEESSKNLDTKNEVPTEVVIFSKPPSTVCGYGDAIEHNSNITQSLDWEVELGVIIGKGGKKIAKKDAYKHVFGYTVINDISARDCRRSGQWIVSKGQDTFAPMGPCIVTADEIKDPHNLRLWLTKNGEMKQDDNTKNMVFKIDDIIVDLSTVMSLDSGDIIASGTPAGVGAGMDPQEWMWPGDVIEAGIEGVGRLYNPVVDITNKKNILED